jgi:hypothetical protein
MARMTPARIAAAQRRITIQRRYLRGETQAEIADACEVTQQRVSQDLAIIHAEMMDRAIGPRREQLGIELAKLDELERRAQINLTRSEQDAQTVRTRTRRQAAAVADGQEPPEDRPDETERTSKGQSGDPRWAAVIAKCIEMRCKLLSLMDSKLILEHTGKDGEPIRVIEIIRPAIAAKPDASE